MSRPNKSPGQKTRDPNGWDLVGACIRLRLSFRAAIFGSVRFHVGSVGKPALFVSSGFLLHTELPENKLPEAWMDFFFVQTNFF